MGGVRTAPHGFAGTEKFLKLKSALELAASRAPFPPPFGGRGPWLRSSRRARVRTAGSRGAHLCSPEQTSTRNAALLWVHPCALLCVFSALVSVFGLADMGSPELTTPGTSSRSNA